MDSVSGLEEAARAAVAVADWGAARAAYEALVAEGPTAEALAGLGDALWWTGETSDAVAHQERAYAGFRAAGDVANSVMTAVALYLTTRVSLGQVAAARGWLGRAARLVEEFDLAPAAGWVALLRAHDAGDPASAADWARQARRLARQAPDPDLELCALGQLGAALVQGGEVSQGGALLDEAVTASLAGEGTRPHTVVFTSCLLISSCALGADVGRVAQWVRDAEAAFSSRPAAHLHATCQVSLASVLFEAGDLAAAERCLASALALGPRGEPALCAQAAAQLAGIRLSQGRLEEAERLLDGLEGYGTSQLVLAQLAAARGEPAPARRLAAQRLRALERGHVAAMEAHRPGLGPVFEQAALCELLVELGDEATSRLATLDALATTSTSAALKAVAGRARGRAAADAGALEDAVAGFAAAGWAREAARTRIELAPLLDAGAAAHELRLAWSALDRMRATRDADRAAAALRAGGVMVGRHSAAGVADLTQREREVLALLGEGLSNQELAQRLFLSRKTVEAHVRHVLAKLGLRNRAEAAAWTVRHREEMHSTS